MIEIERRLGTMNGNIEFDSAVLFTLKHRKLWQSTTFALDRAVFNNARTFDTPFQRVHLHILCVTGL